MSLYRPTHLHIHLDHLMDNFKTLRALNPENGFVCPMIKANAYGHGDVAVAKALSKVGCKFLGVSSVEEGVHLRDHHIREEILVFGFSGPEAVAEMIARSLTPVVSDFYQLSDLTQQVKEPLAIHLKFNTGMHRLGFQPHDVPGVINVLHKNRALLLKGIGTHFHSGGALKQEGSSAWQQNQRFLDMIALFSSSSILYHAYNSAAIVSLYQNKKGFPFGFRPGLLVYGIDPGENLTFKPLVSPVLAFKSKIVSLQQVKSGEVVSYGGTWTASKDSLIGIVPAGYADGVCRSLSNKGEFLVRGQRVPIRGRVCMDYTMIDLSQWMSEAHRLLGEEVVLIGSQGSEEITVEQVAKTADRVTYEVMTGIGERVPRLYGARE